MKTSKIQIHDAKASKKNPNAKYVVKYVGKNGEPLCQSETLNDVKAVKTHIKAMYHCSNNGGDYEIYGRNPIDCTVEQKFVKSGFATPQPKSK
jgi:hypothetical protein